jgi:Xaa-Pro aminopeptidase
MQPFSPQTYQERRHKLLQKVDSGLIVLLGNDEAPMNYKDNVYHFRQDSTFIYFFRVNKPGYAAIIDCEGGTSTLFGHDSTMDDVIWTGPVPSLAEEAAASGHCTYGSIDQFYDAISNARSQGRKIHYLPAYRGDNAIKLSSILQIHPTELNNNASVELIKAIVDLRAVKSADELSHIETAINITREMHMTAISFSKPNLYEYEVVAEMQRICHKYDSDFAYGIIFSINGQTLHNHYHHNKMTSGRMVLNDCGVETQACYASDITRSFPVDKRFTQRQKDIYTIVHEMEVKSIESLQPNVKYKDVHINAYKIMLDGLKNLGLVHGDVETMVHEGVAGLFMPHGLGHMMGLDVHDMEDLGENFVGYTPDVKRSTQLGLKSLRLARALQPGFVLTVEPGIYFIPELIAKWKADQKFSNFINYTALEAYLDFGGVRIEDNVVITENGHRILGEYIPKTISEIEELKS